MYERSESQTRALRDWFNSHGGFLDDGVEISFSEPEGVHLRASRDLNLAGGEKCRTIIRCPSTLSLSYLNVTGDDTVNFPRRGNVGKLLRGYLPDDALACFLLLEQKHIGKSSFWASYISLLPGEDDLTTPLYFSAVDREWLVGTNMLEALPCRERSWRDEHKRGTDRLDELQEDTTIYTWQAYCWARTIFSTRSHAYTDREGRHVPVLYPVVDAMNHRLEAAISRVIANKAVNFSIKEELHKGQLIYNDYGPKGNEELLLGYGFCVPDNPAECFAVQLKNPGDETYNMLRGLIPDRFKCPSWVPEQGKFYLRRRRSPPSYTPHRRDSFESIPRDLLVIFIAISSRRLFGRPIFFYDTGEPSGNLETRSLLAGMLDLFGLLQAKLAILLRPIPHLQKAINSHQKNAQTYRRGQAACIEDSIQELNGMLAVLRYKDKTEDPSGPNANASASASASANASASVTIESASDPCNQMPPSGTFTLREILRLYSNFEGALASNIEAELESAFSDEDISELPLGWALVLAAVYLHEPSDHEACKRGNLLESWRSSSLEAVPQNIPTTSEGDEHDDVTELLEVVNLLAQTYGDVLWTHPNWPKVAPLALRAANLQVLDYGDQDQPGKGTPSRVTYMHNKNSIHPWQVTGQDLPKNCN